MKGAFIKYIILIASLLSLTAFAQERLVVTSDGYEVVNHTGAPTLLVKGTIIEIVKNNPKDWKLRVKIISSPDGVTGTFSKSKKWIKHGAKSLTKPKSKKATAQKKELQKLADKLSKGNLDKTAKETSCVPTSKDSEVYKMVKEFHQGDCKKASRKSRKSFLSKWEAFIKQKAKEGKRDLAKKARAADIVARTGVMENDISGCTASGICERNALMLTMRNRGGGDLDRLVSKTTRPSQYNVWLSSSMEDRDTTECFLNDQDRRSRLFDVTLRQADEMLFGKNFPFSNYKKDDYTLKHYYHPRSMTRFSSKQKCDAYNNTYFLASYEKRKFTLKNGKKITVKGKTLVQVVGKTKSGKLKLKVKHASKWYEIKEEMLTSDLQKLAFQCTANGIPTDCEVGKNPTYRKMPRWVSEGNRLKLKCKNSHGKGKNCKGAWKDEKTKPEVGGRCNKHILMVSGVR